MIYKLVQVTGINTDQNAALSSFTKRGEDQIFMAILSLSCDDAFTKAREHLGDFSDFFFEAEAGAAEKLKATFEHAKEKLSAEQSFDLLLACISGKVLYLLGKGEVEVLCKRGDSISPLQSSQQQLISGFLGEKDRIFLTTRPLLSFLGDFLEQSLKLDQEAWQEEVTSRVEQAQAENQGLVGILLDVEPDLLEEQQEVAIPALEKLVSSLPKGGKVRLILAAVLILSLAVGIGLKYKQTKDQHREKEFQVLLAQSQDKFGAALSLSSLNPNEAKNNLNLAKEKLDKALKIKPQDSQASELKNKISKEENSILQQFSKVEFSLFLDLDLIKKDFSAPNLSLSGSNLLMMDQKTKTLVVVDTSKKSHLILAEKDKLGEASFSSINGGLAFVFSEDKGILRVDIANKKQTSVSKKDNDWGKIADIFGFGGNVYLLDISKNQIWKYLPTTDGYSDKREYLAKDVKVNLANSLRIQIESSIYVLKQGGEMLRFTRGTPDHFSYGGLDKGVKDPKSFFVSSETDNLYVLDSGNSRLLVLTKTGAYKQQYQNHKFGQFSDLVVDEKGKKVYLLEGSKIYFVDLK